MFLALGGSGEIGMNVNLYGCDGKWLMVDLGMTFSDPDYPGVELVFADLEFIEERKADLLGVVASDLFPGERDPEIVRTVLEQMSDRLIVQLDEERYKAALDMASQWQARKYAVVWSNCVDFVIDFGEDSSREVE